MGKRKFHRKSNYVKKVNNLSRLPGILKPGTVTNVHIFHDDNCSFWETGLCNCNPDIKIEGKGINN